MFSFLLLIFFQISFACGAPGDLSKTKCEEYSKHVYAEEYEPTLHVKSGVHSVSKCGIVEVPLIVGGVKAAQNEFPHMAVIGFGKSKISKDLAWHCGGTLISENFILTAGHCLKHRDQGNAQRVRIGTINLQKPSVHMQEIDVGKTIGHPEYSSRSKHNDIGLIKLIKKIIFNEYVHPACINIDENFTWKSALATGFGRLTYESTDGSTELMKVQLSNIEQKDCKKTYKTMITKQFCAGEMAGKKDTCQGDSGGPLQTVLDKPYCMYNIVGITSFGKFCGFENSPGIYTRVASYVEWIESNVWQ